MKYLLLSVVIISNCTYAQNFSKSEIEHWKRQAQQVTIIRDNWGVPHIYGRTDEDVAFGFAYAQAEDSFEHIEDNYIKALGRASEIYGKDSYTKDLLVRALEIPAIAKKQYRQSSGQMQKMYKAFADGLNFFIYTHPAKKHALLLKMESWYPLALLNYYYYVEVFITRVGVSSKDYKVDFNKNSKEITTGSNAWAIAPAKSASGNPMLFINPHVSFFGTATYYEAHVKSEKDWNFSGITRLGFPFPYMGHNEYIGFANTTNYFDYGDLYAEKFDNPKDSLAYKYGNAYKEATEWTDTIVVKIADQKKTIHVRLRKTHHGPIVANQQGKSLAIKLINFGDGSWFDQWYAMTKSKSFNAFYNSLKGLHVPFQNNIYADKAGNIFYNYYGTIPIKDKRFDWSKPVDGSDPETEWKGYYQLSQLPEVLNPSDGFVQNCNSSPFVTTIHNNPDKGKFPSNITGPEADNWRSQRSREILSSKNKFSFNELEAMATDTKVFLRDKFVALVDSEYSVLKAKDIERATKLEPIVSEIKNWDGISTTKSIPMTYFAKSVVQFRSDVPDAMSILENVMNELQKKFGTWKVPYGEICRLQRVTWNRSENFSDARPSIPVPGFIGNIGIIFCFNIDLSENANPPNKASYGTEGNSYVSVIELGEKINAKSILVFGESEDPSSSHYFDQAPLYAEGKFKEAYFDKEDILKHSEQKYHPGDK